MSISKDELLAKLAVKRGLMTLDQLTQCQREFEALDTDAKASYSLLDIIINNGFATQIQLDNLDNSAEKSVLLELSSSPIEHQIIDGYEIREKIGSGAMGVVYRAWHTAIGRDVALKILPPNLAKDDEYKERFLREARAAAKLNHHNIVCAYDVGMSNGLYYFAMEFVEGKSVMQMIKNDGLIEEKMAMKIVLQIAQALKLAWKQLIVHRDVKPENIIINKECVAKLCDLGLAKQVDSDPHLTASGAAVGTPFYISPEQAKGQHEIDIRSDIYSLGATLFHMVVGRPPFEGTSAAVIMTKHINQPLPEPCVLRKSLSPKVGYIIKKMMQKTPEARYQNPEELIEDVNRFLEGAPLVKGKTTKIRDSVQLPKRPTSAIREGRIPSGEILAQRKMRPTVSHAQPNRTSQKSSRNTLIVVSLIVLVAAIVLTTMFLGDSDNPSTTSDTPPRTVVKPENKPPDKSETTKPEVEESKDQPDDKFKKKLDRFLTKITEDIKTADEFYAKKQFEQSIILCDQILANDAYKQILEDEKCTTQDKDKFQELLKQAESIKNNAKNSAEDSAFAEIQKNLETIKSNNWDNESALTDYKNILTLWNNFSSNLKFTETYKTQVADEKTGIIAKLHEKAEESFQNLKTEVLALADTKEFNKALNLIDDGFRLLPDTYASQLSELKNNVENHVKNEKDEIKRINLERIENAPILYESWTSELKTFLSEMKINEALTHCESNLNSIDFNLNEEVVKKLNIDLNLLKMIQIVYLDIYSLIKDLGSTGKTIKIDFDEDKDAVLYIKCTNIETLDETCEFVPASDFSFNYIQSTDPQKADDSVKYKFSELPDNLSELLLRYAMMVSKDAKDLKYTKLVTFYALNLPEFPKVNEGDLENALINIIKILTQADSEELTVSMHPIIESLYKTRFEAQAEISFAYIEKNFKLWERKSKGKSKTALGEELVNSINAMLAYFSNSKILTENDGANAKKLQEWLEAIKKRLIEDKDIQLFYGEYKLKSNKLEITYDFSEKEQILDFATTENNNNGIYGWDKKKKAMIVSANPSFRRESRNVASIKWLPKFGDKEFDIKIEYEVPHALFYSLNLFKTDESKQYSIPLRARLVFWQNVMQIKHGLYNGPLDIRETEKNKLLGDASEEMAPESGTFIYRVKRDRKGYITSYINNKQVFKVKDETYSEGFMEFNAIFARFYIKRMEIECELDKDWLKDWEKALKEDKDPRKDNGAEFWDTDEEFKKRFEWDRDRGPGGPGGGSGRHN